MDLSEPLVSLNEALAHILWPPMQAGSPSTDIERDMLLKLQSAQSIILDYLDTRVDETWDSTSVPALVKAAILIEFAELVRYRGDDKDGELAQTDGYLSPQVTNILRRWRDPVLR
jgi:hypothetical protein